MRFKTTLLAGAAIAAIGLISTQANASLSLNQWYTGSFTTTGTPVGAGLVLASNGPVLPSGTANGVSAPASPWVFTLSSPGYLVVTDLEEAGDAFQFFDNGSPMTPLGSTPLGGQPGQAGGLTSTPTLDYTNNGDNIGFALGDSEYSSGTFVLPAGNNAITATFLGTIGHGNLAFIAESVPEPATLSIIGLGLAGLGALRRRKSKV